MGRRDEERESRAEAAKYVCCAECGYHRDGRHHPQIRCPETGRCGECGSDWPCAEHAKEVR